MKIFRVIYLLLLCIAVTSCSDEEGFRITGIIEGLDDTVVDMYYYSGGGIKSEQTISRGGKFRLLGNSAVPTLVTVSIPTLEIVTYVVAENGNTVEIKGNAGSPLEWKVSGNKASSGMASFVRDNAEAITSGDSHSVNSAIAAYVASNRSSLTSGALLVTRFHVPGYEMLADSLLSLLDPEARPVAVMQNFGAMLARQLTSEAQGELTSMALYAGLDSVVRLTPSRQSYFLLAFVGETPRQRDTIVPRLREFTETYPLRRFKALEISMAPDSASWRRSVENDSALWMQAWLPGYLSAPQIRKMSVPTVPYFIIGDSTGHQLYRGSSVTAVSEKLAGMLAGKVAR